VRRLLAVAFFALSSAAFAQTPEQQAAIEQAERVGREIYEHDRAAWLGTDAIREDMGDDVGRILRGWITERQGNDVVATFVTSDGDRPRSLYRAVLRNGALVGRGQANAPLAVHQLALYRARQRALQSDFAACSPTYNTVALPSADGAFADIYLLPGTTDANLVLVGGAHRLRVNLATNEIVETQAFSRSCLTLQRGPGAAGLFFTHLTTPMPTETHVFLNLSMGLPLYVGAEQGVWSIEEGRIRLVRERAE